jgi:hypothetical protein
MRQEKRENDNEEEKEEPATLDSYFIRKSQKVNDCCKEV